MKKEDLKKLRLEKNLSQEKFAGLLGITVSYYTKLENGSKAISKKMVDKLRGNK